MTRTSKGGSVAPPSKPMLNLAIAAAIGEAAAFLGVKSQVLMLRFSLQKTRTVRLIRNHSAARWCSYRL